MPLNALTPPNTGVGRVDIIVNRCTGLPETQLQFIKKRSYFVQVIVEGKVQRTSNLRQKNQTLEWNETFSFDFVDTSSVTMCLYCPHTLNKPELIAQVTLPVSDIQGTAPKTISRSASLPGGYHIHFVLTGRVTRHKDTIEKAGGDEPIKDTSRRPTNQLPKTSGGRSPGPSRANNASGHGKIDGLSEDNRTAAHALAEAKKALDNQSTLSIEWRQMLELLVSFKTITGAIAEVNPYAKIAHGIFFGIALPLAEQVTRDETIQDLFNAFMSFYELINDPAHLHFLNSNEMKAVLKLASLQLVEVAFFVRGYCEDGGFVKRALKSKVFGVDDIIKQYRLKFEELKDEFRSRVALLTGSMMMRTERVAMRTEAKVTRVLKKVEDIGYSIDLNDLTYIPRAGWNADKQCLLGTREKVLEDLAQWICLYGPRVLLLCGGAGTGKSAIAHTIAGYLKQLGRLGSMFCFSETDKTTRSPESLLPHIARDLADLDEHIRVELCRSARNKADRTTLNIKTQFEKLVLSPVNAIRENLQGPIVVVIDALDESGTVEERSELLKVLSSRLKDLPPNFRILITSRPDSDIIKAFHSQKASDALITRMNSIPLETTTKDIAVFVNTQLSGLHQFDANMCHRLASQAHGLFQWARVACQFILNQDLGETALDRFEQILPPKTARSGVEGDKLLDYLYRAILDRALSSKSEASMAKFKFVMALVLTAFEPLSCKALNQLIAASRSAPGRCRAEDIIARLSSLLDGADDHDAPIRLLHVTFRNFLSDCARSGEFFVDLQTPDIHADMAWASLSIMTKLEFNICRIPTSYLPNKKVPGIEESVKKHIPPQLSYACRFWASHLCSLPSGSKRSHTPAVTYDWSQLIQKVYKVFCDHTLHFLEVISLLEAVDRGLREIRRVIRWIQANEGEKSVILFIEDIERFWSYFAKPIAISVPHIYLSALPFAPTSSSVAKKYLKPNTKTLNIVTGQLQHYPSCLNVLYGHTDWVGPVSFSPDGVYVASGSHDKTIRLWNAENGNLVLEPLKGHHGHVLSVAFSPDGTRIASGSSDRTIRIWRTDNGKPIPTPLGGHTDNVNSVAFSPVDGTCIVSGSSDHTIRVWKLGNSSDILPPFKGHTKSVNSVAFSPDGKRIVSASDDKTIRIWNAANGQLALKPLEGHNGEVTSALFSPDGALVASGSADWTIRVWKAETGELVLGPLHGHRDWVKSVHFSPDGTRITSCSYDRTIRIWSTENDDYPTEPLEGHADQVFSVALSPDGTRIASGSKDKTVRIWHAENSAMFLAPLDGHTDSVNSVSFSPDGNRIVSASHDKTIRVWNAVDGELVLELGEDHTSEILLATFSSNAAHVASISAEGIVRIWNVENGKLVLDSQPLKDDAGYIECVAVSSDLTYVASGSGNNILVRNIDDGELTMGPLKGHTGKIRTIAFSADGGRIVSGADDRTVRVWSVEKGEAVLGPLTGHNDWVRAVAFSPDATRIASGSDDLTIRIWNAKNGQLVFHALNSHTQWIKSVAFSPDGALLASGSYDKTIRVWSIENAQMVIGPLKGHTQHINSVAFSADSSRVVSGSSDTTISVHSLSGSKPPSTNDSTTFKSCLPLIPPTRKSEEIIPKYCWRIEDGWSLGLGEELLFYVPPVHLQTLCEPCTIFARGSRHVTKMEMSRYVHGPHWTECIGSGVKESFVVRSP